MKEPGFNNTRRPKIYWYAVIMLLAIIFNLRRIAQLYLIADDGGNILSFIFTLLSNMLPMFDITIVMAYVMLEVLIITVLLGSIAIKFINYFVEKIPEPQRPCRSIFKFISKPSFICDIVLGVMLITIAVISLYTAITDGSRVIISGSIVNLLYIVFLICGTVMYWKAIFPYERYKKMINSIKNSDGEITDVWYTITGSKLITTTFKQLPVKKKYFTLMVDKEDMECLNDVCHCIIRRENFSSCLLFCNQEETLDNSFWDEVIQIQHIPHIKTVLMYYGDDSYKAYLYKKLNSLHFHDVEFFAMSGRKSDIVMEVAECMKNCESLKQNCKGNPLLNLQNPQLQECYMSLWKGPHISFDVLKLCMNELEVLPAIYALFDYIDLQYRLSISFYADSSAQWYEKNSKKIGNINEMAQILKEKNQFDNSFCIKKEDVLLKEDYSIIKKYLPTYMAPDYYRYIDIIYLSKQLRNVLRGHGSFEHVHAMALYQLVFRFAIMTFRILNMDRKQFAIHDLYVNDYYNIEGKTGSLRVNVTPFLLGTEKGTVLIFNNYVDGTFEYINYLDGTLILPFMVRV